VAPLWPASPNEVRDLDCAGSVIYVRLRSDRAEQAARDRHGDTEHRAECPRARGSRDYFATGRVPGSGASARGRACQLDFLRRLDGGALPIQEHTLDVARDVLTLDVTPSSIFRGKTGAASPPEELMEVGWFVGYVELGERRVFFATVIDGHAPEVDVLPVRRRITERVLRALGDLPS
jgi:hypothetical protein